MKLLALGLTAAIAAGAALSATPADAGVYIDYGYSSWHPHHWGPPPPRPYWGGGWYRPRPVYYGGYGYGYGSDRVCTTRYVTRYGAYGPYTSKITDCRTRY